MDLINIASDIIINSTFLTLATTDGQKPWANAVFFAIDNKYNFFFTSYNDSQHVRNILKNPLVSIAIFDSHSIPGSHIQEVQIQGACHRVNTDGLGHAINILYSKRFPNKVELEKHDLSIEHFTLPDSVGRTDHIYIIVPSHFYVLDQKKGKDTRIEISFL